MAKRLFVYQARADAAWIWLQPSAPSTPAAQIVPAFQQALDPSRRRAFSWESANQPYPYVSAGGINSGVFVPSFQTGVGPEARRREFMQVHNQQIAMPPDTGGIDILPRWLVLMKAV